MRPGWLATAALATLGFALGRVAAPEPRPPRVVTVAPLVRTQVIERVVERPCAAASEEVPEPEAPEPEVVAPPDETGARTAATAMVERIVSEAHLDETRAAELHELLLTLSPEARVAVVGPLHAALEHGTVTQAEGAFVF